jgi:hypothetical protein
MEQIDFRKQAKELYQPSAKEPTIVHVPPMRFVMIDGAGDPNSSAAFEEAVQALYGVAYTIKFARKKAPGPAGVPDFVVPPLEGLWWMKGGRRFDSDRRADWRWTLMIRLPDHVREKDVSAALAELERKKPSPSLARVRFERFAEGRAAQIMHVGPYADEPPTIARLHAFVAGQGYALHGKHHEIYLGDPRRTKPEKLRTVLRHPVKRNAERRRGGGG